jgi:two-component system, NtrC family, response regulator AtoC
VTFAPPMSVTLVGASPAMRRAVSLADRFARTALPILVTGATGTGKELLARRIHAMSERNGPLVPVNCAALPREIVESLLFGYGRGAFTGAVHDCAGFIETAHYGTLYLDELSSLPLEAQGKLLRVLESKDVYRLGETKPRRVDFRLVASCQDDLAVRVGDGRFRLDLYQRIVGVRVDLVPLLERVEDVVLLAEHFASLRGWTMTPEARAVLVQYDWPGNVRELQAVVERAGVLSTGEVIGSAVVAEAIGLGRVPSDRNGNGERLSGSGTDRASLIQLCMAHGCDARRIAAACGWGLSTVYRRVRGAGVSLRHLRKSHFLSGILDEKSESSSQARSQTTLLR